MRPRRFAWGLGLLGLAVLELVAALAFEHTRFLRGLPGGILYLVTFSALQLGGAGLLWSDLQKRLGRWVVAFAVSVLVVGYHLALLHGPG